MAADFSIAPLTDNHGLAPEGARVELWDAEGVRDVPFMSEIVNSGTAYFGFSEGDTVEFFGKTIARFYVRVVDDVQLPRNANGDPEKKSTEMVWANTRTDVGSWDDARLYEKGMLTDVFQTRGETFDIPMTARYYAFFLQQLKNGGSESVPLSNAEMNLAVIGSQSGLIDIPTFTTNSNGRGVARIHSIKDEPNSTLELRQKRPPLSDRALSDIPIVDDSPGVEIFSIDIEPEFGGTVTVEDSDEEPIENAVLELRDHEDMEKGPLRSLITDVDGEVEVEFSYADLIQFYGRFVDRFFFQAHKGVDKVVDSLTDQLEGTTTPLDGDGVWFLSEDSSLGGLELRSSAQYAQLEIVDFADETPEYEAWVQLFDHRATPNHHEPIEISRVNDDGVATFRRSILEDSNEAYFFRLISEHEEPLDLRPVDAPRALMPRDGLEGFEETSGYWKPSFPSPRRDVFRYRLDRERTLRVRGRVTDSASEEVEGLPGISVSLFGNATTDWLAPRTVSSGEDDKLRMLDAVGDEIWAVDHEVPTATPHQIATDPQGNVYASSEDGSVSKYDRWGSLLWTFDGHSSATRAVAVDSQGNVYSGSNDKTVRKLDPHGTEIWQFDGHTGDVLDVAVDANGFVYSVSADQSVRKITPGGEEVWQYNGHTGWVFGVGVDKEGNVFSSSEDESVRKLDADGNEQWIFTGHTWYVRALAITSDGHVHTASQDKTTRKIDPDGNEIWSVDLGSGMNTISVDPLGNSYLVTQKTVRKLDSSGGEVWTSNIGADGIALAVEPGSFEAFPDQYKRTPEAAAITRADGSFELTVSESAFDLLQKTRLDSALTFISPVGEEIPVREFDGDGSYVENWKFKFSTDVVRVNVEADAGAIDGLGTVRYELLGQLFDGDPEGSGVPAEGGFVVRAIESGSGITRAEVSTSLHGGYFSLKWSESYTVNPDTTRDFDFEISTADGLVDVAISGKTIDLETDEFSIGADLTPGSPDPVAIQSMVQLGSQTPYQYIASLDPGTVDVIQEAKEYRKGVLWKKMADVIGLGVAGEHASGFPTQVSVPSNLTGACYCESCAAVFGRLAYLADLIDFAENRVELDGALSDVQQWSDVLGQPIASFPLDCSLIGKPVSAARIAVEVLRHQLAEQTEVTRSHIAWQVHPYRIAAYSSLLGSYGVTMREFLNLPSPSSSLPHSDGTRERFAHQLGIAEENLETFLLDPEQSFDAVSGVSEKTLENLFGLRATECDTDFAQPIPNPFESLSKPTLLQLQQEQLEELWTVEDHSTGADDDEDDPFNWDYPIIDPQIVTIAEVVADSDAATRLKSRRELVETWGTAMTSHVDPQETDEKVFDDILTEADLPGFHTDNPWGNNLQPIVDDRNEELPFREDLASYYLDISALDFLTELRDRVEDPGADSVQMMTWVRMVSHLIAAKKRDAYDQWRTDEEVDGILLSPRFFHLLDEVDERRFDLEDVPANTRPMFDHARRRSWESTLRNRYDRWETLQTSLDEAVEAAESAALPILRQLLVDEVFDELATELPEYRSAAEKAEWCTSEFLIDMKLTGSVRRTRPQQAIESVQTALYGARIGSLNSSVVDVEIDSYDFDEVWKWLGEYSAWQTTQSILAYPENFLGVIPRSTETTLFKEFREILSQSHALTPERACEVADFFAEGFRSRTRGLRVKASCHVELRHHEASACQKKSYIKEDSLLLFAEANRGDGTRDFLWSNVRLRDHHQGDWHRLPLQHENVAEIFGAAIGDGSVFVFYNFDDGDEGYQIAALILDLETQEWDTEEFGESRMARQVRGLHHVTQQGRRGKFPRIVVQDNSQIRFCAVRLERRSRGVWLSLPTGWLFRMLRNTHGQNVQFDLPQDNQFELQSVVQGDYGDAFAVISWADSVVAVIRLTRAAELWARARQRSVGRFLQFEQILDELLSPFHADHFAVLLGPGRPVGVFLGEIEFSVLSHLGDDINGVVAHYRVRMWDGISYARENGPEVFDAFDAGRLKVLGAAQYCTEHDVGSEHPIVFASLASPSATSETERVTTLSRLSVAETTPYTIREERMTYIAARTMILAAQTPRVLSASEASKRRSRLPDLIDVMREDGSAISRKYIEELYFFAPLYLAKQLREHGHYRAALDWLRTVYDYSAAEEKRNIYPLGDNGFATDWTGDAVDWLKNPLDPHTVAAIRSGTYRKYVLFETVQTLLNGADESFQRETDDHRVRARELYRLALDILDEADLLVSLPADCDLSEFEVKLRQEISTPVDPLDEIAFAEVLRQLRRIADPDARSDAADDVIQAVKDVTDGTPAEELEAALIASHEAVEDLPYPDDYMARLDDDATLRDQLRDEVAGTDELIVLVNRLSLRLEEGFLQGLDSIFFNDDLGDISEVELHGFLSDPDTTGPPWFGATLAYSTGPYSPQSGESEMHLDGDDGTLLKSYIPVPRLAFCSKPNPLFDLLRASAEANLEKIRMNLTIGGYERPSLPERDLAMEAAYVALTGDMSNLVGPQNAFPQTQFRFRVLLDIAYRFLSSAARVESAYFAALKDYDNEMYRIHEASQAMEIVTASDQVNQLRVQAAEQEINVAVEQIGLAEFKQEHFKGLVDGGLLPSEWGTLGAQLVAGVLHAGAVATHVTLGEAGAAVSSAAAGASATASLLQTTASFRRREQEWKFQEELANREGSIAFAQWRARDAQRNIAAAERRIGEIRIEHAEETLEFLEQQFTSAEFYEALVGIYREAYAAILGYTTEVARLAQVQLEFERLEPISRPIGENYFLEAQADTSGNEIELGGIGGTARLEADLVKLENESIDTKNRRLNVSKTFSVRSLFPGELFSLQREGRMTLPFRLEEHFEPEFPGQYNRRIENVRVSVVALTPPAQGIRASLTNISQGLCYVDSDGNSTALIGAPGQRIDFTSPDSASGLFELDPQSELLRPFEGLGVQTTFQLDMPLPANRWDMTSIYDVLLTVDYTARHSSKKYDDRAKKANNNPRVSEQRAFSLRNEFGDQWYDLLHADLEGELPTISFDIERAHFRPHLRDIKTNAARLFIVTSFLIGQEGEVPNSVDVDLDFEPEETADFKAGTATDGVASSNTISNWDGAGFQDQQPDTTWEFRFPMDAEEANAIAGLIEADELVDIVLALEYSADAPIWPTDS